MSTTAGDDTANVKDLQRDVGSLRTKLFYGFGSVAFGVKDNGFQTILLLFYNQVLHLSSQAVGLVLFAALCVDALFDPIIGQFSDNLRTRWGRRHPLLYISALPVAVSSALSRMSSSSAPLATISCASLPLIFGTAALAASISCLTLVGMRSISR